MYKLEYVRMTNQMHTFISFICFNYAVLYMFRTNKSIIRRLLLYKQHIAFSMHVYDV